MSYRVTEPISSIGSADACIKIWANDTCPPYYEVSVFDESGTNVGNTTTVCGLGAGQYTIVVTDTCESVSLDFMLSDELKLKVVDFNQPICGSSLRNGRVDFEASGGAPPYTFEYTGGDEIPSISEGRFLTVAGMSSEGLGLKSLVVTDENNSQVNVDFLLEGRLRVDATGLQPASCTSACDGTFEFLVLFGTEPYTLVSGQAVSVVGENRFRVTGLCEGPNDFVFEDADGCQGLITKDVYALDQNCQISENVFGDQCIFDECASNFLPVCGDDGIMYHNICHALCLGATVVDTDCQSTDEVLRSCPGAGLLIGDPPINEDAIFFWSPNYGLDCYDCPYATVDPLDNGITEYTRKEYLIDEEGFGLLSDLPPGGYIGQVTVNHNDFRVDDPDEYYGPFRGTHYKVEPDWSCSVSEGTEAFPTQYTLCAGVGAPVTMPIGVAPEGGINFIQGPSNGVVSIGPAPFDGTPPTSFYSLGYTYTPNPGFVGTDTLFFAITFMGIRVRSVHVYIDVEDCNATGSEGTSVQVSLSLEGAMQGGTMHTFLNENGLLPLEQPYNRAPYFYAGNESLESFDPSIVDWVLVDLRDEINSDLVVERVAALLKQDGTVVDVAGSPIISFPNASAGSYWIVVQHRNHLAVGSNSPVTLPNAIPFDFSGSESSSNGNDQVQHIANQWSLTAGDLNSDGIINVLDSILWFHQNNFLNTYSNAELNMDGTVNFLDFLLWFKNNNILGLY